MLDAFEKAGILLPDNNGSAEIALQALEKTLRWNGWSFLDPDPEATLCLFTVQEIEVRWQRHLDAVAKETGASRGVLQAKGPVTRPNQPRAR